MGKPERGYIQIVFDFSRTATSRKIRQFDTKPFLWTVKAPADQMTVRSTGRGLAVPGSCGEFLLNCWFENSIEAELHFSSDRYFPAEAAAIFSTEDKKSLASNWGTQCMLRVGAGPSYTRGVIRKSPRTVIRLVVGQKLFSAQQQVGEKVKHQEMPYPSRHFKSGRVGFRWGSGMNFDLGASESGSVESILMKITRLEIKGKLDMDRMRKVLEDEKKSQLNGGED